MGCRVVVRKACLEKREEGGGRLEDARKKKVWREVKRREGQRYGWPALDKAQTQVAETFGPCARSSADSAVHGVLLPPVNGGRPREEPGNTWG